MNTRELVNYLQGLAENNNRAWFVMNKPSYDILRAEFVELVARVIAATEKFDPAVAGQEAKKPCSGSTATCVFPRTRARTRATFRR